MKILIRTILIIASGFMVIGNWHSNTNALTASFLFLIANLSSLIYNELKPKEPSHGTRPTY